MDISSLYNLYYTVLWCYFNIDWTHVQHQGTWWKQAPTEGNPRSLGAALWASQHVGVTSRFSMSWTEADAVSFSKRLRPSCRIAKMMRWGVTERNQILRQGRRLFSSKMFKTSPNIRLSAIKNGKLGVNILKSSCGEGFIDVLWTSMKIFNHQISPDSRCMPGRGFRPVLVKRWGAWEVDVDTELNPPKRTFLVAYFWTNPSLTSKKTRPPSDFHENGRSIWPGYK